VGVSAISVVGSKKQDDSILQPPFRPSASAKSRYLSIYFFLNANSWFAASFLCVAVPCDAHAVVALQLSLLSGAGFLGVSVLAVPFTFSASFATKAHAAECLLQFLLSNQLEYAMMMRDCRTAYRLGFVLKQIFEHEDGAISKFQ
jgi:hypothetical protein